MDSKSSSQWLRTPIWTIDPNPRLLYAAQAWLCGSLAVLAPEIRVGVDPHDPDPLFPQTLENSRGHRVLPAQETPDSASGCDRTKEEA